MDAIAVKPDSEKNPTEISRQNPSSTTSSEPVVSSKEKIWIKVGKGLFHSVLFLLTSPRIIKAITGQNDSTGKSTKDYFRGHGPEKGLRRRGKRNRYQ